MASHKSSDDISSTPPARPIRRNASELDVASLLTGPIDEGQTVVGMAAASNVPGMFDFAMVDIGSMVSGISAAYKPNVMLDFAKVDVSSMVSGISAAYKPNVMLDFAKLNVSSMVSGISTAHKASALADFAKVDVSSMLSSIATFDFDAMLSSSETQALLRNSQFRDELDELISQLPDGEPLLDEAVDDLIQFISFEHNETVRKFLQLLIVLVFHTFLAGAYMVPLLSSALSAHGTPSVKQTWTATGVAYDRLYGIEHYHPDKALEKGKTSITRSGSRRTTRR